MNYEQHFLFNFLVSNPTEDYFSPTEYDPVLQVDEPVILHQHAV